MRFLFLSASLTLLAVPFLLAYVEAPHTLGRCIQESSHIVLVEVVKVNKERGLILFKKVKDLKGTELQAEIKHNIGQRGFHPREWQTVMAWAEVGKKAVFFHNGGASETCIGTYWYQCYREGDWWGMSHAEPYLLRTYYGDPEKLAAAVTEILQGKEVVVPCLADGNREQLHLRKGKLQRLRASLKRLDYNAKRDFVGWGGDGEVVEEFRTITLLPQGADGWRYLPAPPNAEGEASWRALEFTDAGWQLGKAPVGYGEDEIRQRQGTVIAERGIPFVFRRGFEIASDLLTAKGVTFRLSVASDDNATVHLNGQLADQDPEGDHEFRYWNREVEIPANLLRPGRNVVAVYVRNRQGSSDLYFDLELTAEVPLPKRAVAVKPTARPAPAGPLTLDARPNPLLVVDREKRTVTVPCLIAPRKLPNLNDVYPIEVVATYPAPQGQKAHETIVTFRDIKPSQVHVALEQLGLKPGKPARGDEKAEGPELRLYLEFAGADGQVRRLPLEQAVVQRGTQETLPPPRWHFTGSSARQPDPDKDEWHYGADLTGTLAAFFPVTDDTVIQSSLTMQDESRLKLETNAAVLPKEGTPVKLVIEVPNG